ncbi:unnamed protein product [Mytilus coruscus]|uniref:Uncharacterized protein n=1 Tax=Mytilus coruscus TaxID=42192 RepID=A0A6J8EZ72_MYTCO|nr:unnamed protein product [Mytilus coruscus]
MDDRDTFVNCNNKFKKRNRGYKRPSIDSHNKLPAISLRSVLNNTIDTQVTPDKSLYVWNTCASSVVKIHKSQSTTKEALDEVNKLQVDTSYIRKRKRPMFQSTPSKQTFEFVSPQSSVDKSLFSPVSKKRCNISSPKKVVASPKKASARSSKAFMDKAFQALRSSHYFSAFKCLYEKSKSARQGFVKLIKYAVRQEIKRLDLGVINIDEKNHVEPLLPAKGILLANILNVRYPTRINFMQNIFYVEMYISGCSHKIFRWFNRLRLCTSVTTTQRVIDDLCANFDSRIKNWQHNIQIDAGNWRAVRVPVCDDSSSEPGLSLCWDNVQKPSIARHKGGGTDNTMMLWALSFATRNRIGFLNLDDLDETVPVKDIPLHDCMNNGNSAGSRGSLFQIRNRFKFKNVKKKISDCINDTQDFWTFVTEGLVCVLCCKLLNVTSLEEIPNHHDGDITELLKHISVQIVSMIWPSINKESFNHVK